MASKSWTPSIIKTIAHEDKEIIYLYIDAWIGKQKVNKTLVNSDAVMELINWKVIHNLDSQVYRIDEK